MALALIARSKEHVDALLAAGGVNAATALLDHQDYDLKTNGALILGAIAMVSEHRSAAMAAGAVCALTWALEHAREVDDKNYAELALRAITCKQ